MNPADKANATELDALFATILARRDDDPATSWTAKLFTRGRSKIAQKVGEEAVETVIAAMKGNTAEVTAESADLLYHLLVLWADCGVSPEEVWTELARRSGTSGIAEKKARPQG